MITHRHTSQEMNRLKFNLVFQLLAITLPIIFVLFVQTWQIGYISKNISHESSISIKAAEARRYYRNFVDGAVDAVDLGALSNKSLDELRKSADRIADLSELSPSIELKDLNNQLNGEIKKLSADSSLSTLLSMKENINLCNAKLIDIANQLEACTGQVKPDTFF